ncbi:MAG TPA: hypothetical protein VN922_01685 [Bacteroidia bacterium]|nr:hypothetical protein [Bacteroidia bacterium]
MEVKTEVEKVLYKVKSLSVLGLDNKIYKSGGIVSDDMFEVRQAEELVEEGHLELYTEEPAKPSKEDKTKKK